LGVTLTGTMYCLKGNQTSDTGGSGGTWDATWIKLAYGNEVQTLLSDTAILCDVLSTNVSDK
jgi:hypothetical protein